MTDHELRRAISRGQFTDLLDSLATDAIVLRALNGCHLPTDKVQQLLLRYFACTTQGIGKFGKPSISQQGLETMKQLNKEMEAWLASASIRKHEDLRRPLLRALDLATQVFGANEPFRRAAPLVKQGASVDTKKVWVDSTKPHHAIWDVVVLTFADPVFGKKHADILANSAAVRAALIDLMQMHSAFTDSLRVEGTSKRVLLFTAKLHHILDHGTTHEHAPIDPQTRRDLIAAARTAGRPCAICRQPLGPWDDHLHIDHIQPRSKGGNNEPANLQVVHKLCNLRKSDKLPAQDAKS